MLHLHLFFANPDSFPPHWAVVRSSYPETATWSKLSSKAFPYISKCFMWECFILSLVWQWTCVTITRNCWERVKFKSSLVKPPNTDNICTGSNSSISQCTTCTVYKLLRLQSRKDFRHLLGLKISSCESLNSCEFLTSGEWEGSMLMPHIDCRVKITVLDIKGTFLQCNESNHVAFSSVLCIK